jgi:hypothetical protein
MSLLAGLCVGVFAYLLDGKRGGSSGNSTLSFPFSQPAPTL